MASNTLLDNINKAKLIHNTIKYDYTRLKEGLRTTHKVTIICPVHGPFIQLWKNHLKGRGCSKCANENRNNNKKLTVEKFIEKAKKIHGDKYDYSEITSINGNNTVLPIKCRQHGYTNQSAKLHFYGGCNKCARKDYGQTLAKGQYAIDEMKEKYQQMNRDYDLSLSVYESAHANIIVICNKHGQFVTSHNKCMRGHGCHKCGKESSVLFKTKTQEQFLQEAHKIHGNKYDYSSVEYKNTKEPIIIICEEHGTFSQSPECHLRGQGCPEHTESKGEIKIGEILNKRQIHYERDKQLPGLKHKKSLRIDFYWEQGHQAFAIEYDGEQHFKPVKHFGGLSEFKKIQERDKIKTIYCLKNGIRLLRISYKEYDDIEEIIDHFLLMSELPMTFKWHCVY